METDILVNVFFKDYQIALLPFILISQSNIERHKSIKQYPALTAMKILEDAVPKSEQEDAFDGVITTWLKKRLA